MTLLNKLYTLIFASLLLNAVICLENTEESIYYETNFLISTFENLKSKTPIPCNSISDCPIYATECSKSCINKKEDETLNTICSDKNICNFEFKCRTNYPCLLKFKDINQFNSFKERYDSQKQSQQPQQQQQQQQQQQPSNNNEDDFIFNGEFKLGKRINLNMRTCFFDTENYNATYSCSPQQCNSNNDCYSRKCDDNRCSRNSKFREFVCSPFDKTIDCKYDLQQSCKKDNECASNVCDYSGICLYDKNSQNVQLYKNEIKKFYIFISIIFGVIILILICSCYCNRSIKKGSNNRKKHRLND